MRILSGSRQPWHPLFVAGRAPSYLFSAPFLHFSNLDFFFFFLRSYPRLLSSFALPPEEPARFQVLAQTEGKGEPGSSPTISVRPKETALTLTPRSPQAAPDCAVKRKRERERLAPTPAGGQGPSLLTQHRHQHLRQQGLLGGPGASSKGFRVKGQILTGDPRVRMSNQSPRRG